MFKCSKCNNSSKSGEQQTKQTVETRTKEYINVKLQNMRNKRAIKVKYVFHILSAEEKKDLEFMGFKVVKEWKTTGTEIVKEQNICKECSKK